MSASTASAFRAGPATCRRRTSRYGRRNRATRHGFDEWFGIPYSNDNSKYHPVLAAEMPPLPLHDGDRMVELDPDQSQFTRRFTERAVSFIERNAKQPFFLYLPHVMPHVPIFASEKFKGRSSRGLYGDVVEELDASIGTLLAALDKHGLREKTLVEAVASSLTEMFAPTIHQRRLDNWPALYPWIDPQGYTYFRKRLAEARRDVEHGLAVTLECFTTRDEQEYALNILQFKLDILWTMLDAMWMAYVADMPPFHTCGERP